MASRFPTPFSFSRELRNLDPLQDLHREMNRLFADAFSGGAAGAGGTMSMPRIDVHESEQEICITADLPGVKPSEVDLRIDGDLLTISGERKSESEREERNVHISERSMGRFQRSIQLPYSPDAQQVRAESHQGVLTIHVPKQPEQQRSRRIEVRDMGSEGEGGVRAPAAGGEQPQGGTTGANAGTTH